MYLQNKMKKIIFILFISVAQFACSQNTSTTRDADAFKTEIAKPNVVLLDVRTPEEFAEGHLQGAVNVDFKNENFSTKVDSLDKTKQYEVYCRSGHRSGESVKLMKEKGFDKVHDLKGGILNWQEKGNAVVK